MTTDVIPLGTSAAIPTSERHLSALAVERKGRLLLFDCGEGTQFRLLDAGLNRARVDAVFVTHLHGDHVYGLPGLAATVAQLQRPDPVSVVGPPGLRRMLAAAAGGPDDRPPEAVEVTELPEDLSCATVYETDELTVEARPLEHRVYTAGFRLEEKTRRGRFDPDAARRLGVDDPADFGRLAGGAPVRAEGGRLVRPDEVLGPPRPGVAVAYVTDSRPCDGGRALADGADLVYHDATFTEAHRERALETAHATAREAARVARDAGARRLLLGHFSARYDDPAPLVEEARSVFDAADAAEELARYTLDPREKW